MTDTADLSQYRPNVGMVLFRTDGLALYCKRLGAPDPYQWQFPQGGVDDGEDIRTAVYREMEEEIGVNAELVQLLDETPDWLSYDFPPEIREKMSKRGAFRGQRQKWFAFRFIGRDSDIRLDAHEREFSDWRWDALAKAPDLVIPFKRAAYETIAQRFSRFSVGAQDEDGLP